MNLFFIGILILILSGISTLFFNNNSKIKITTALTILASFFCAIPAICVLHNGENISQSFNFNEIYGSVSFTVDALSAFFVALISIMSPIFSTGCWIRAISVTGSTPPLHPKAMNMISAP